MRGSRTPTSLRVWLAFICVAGALSIAYFARITPRSGGSQPVTGSNPLPATWAEPGRGWGEVQGTVTDALGKPVPDATVVAQDLRGFGGLGSTDASGKFHVALGRCSRIEPRWPGRDWGDVPLPARAAEIYLAAKAAGYSSSTVETVTALRGEVMNAPRIQLWRGGSIRGRVLTLWGDEVPARVRIVRASSGRARPPRALEGLPPGFDPEFVSSKPGAGFVLSPVPPGRVELWATAPGTGGGSIEIDVAEGETASTEIRIDQLTCIAGRVLGHDGEGVSSASVFCREEPQEGGDRLRVPILSQREGAGAGVADGQPRTPPILSTRTEMDGTFRFCGVKQGVPHIVGLVGAPPAKGAVVSSVFPDRDEVILKRPRTFALSGKVIDGVSRRPVEGCAIQVRQEEVASYMRLMVRLGFDLGVDELPRTDAAGRFTVPDLFEGEYRIDFLAQGYEPATSAIKVSGVIQKPTVVSLVPAAILTGTIRSESNRSVPGATVEASIAEPKPGRGESGIRWTGRLTSVTEEDGSFRIEGLPSGEEILLRVRDPRTGSAAQTSIGVASSERRRLDLGLQPPGGIEALLVPGHGGLCPGYPVRITGIDDPNWDLSLTSDGRGLVRVAGLSPGAYRVSAADPLEDVSLPDVSARIVNVQVAAGQTAQVTITVPDFTSLKGRVQLDEEPVVFGRIGFGPLEGTPDHFRPLLFEVRDGRFEATVPAGRYHLYLAVPGKRYEMEKPFEVVNACSQEARLVFRSS